MLKSRVKHTRMKCVHLCRWPLVPCGGLGRGLRAAAVAIAAPDPQGWPLERSRASGQAESAQLPSPPAHLLVLADRDRRLGEKGMTAGSPVMIRIFKAESELELWLHEGRALRAVRHLSRSASGRAGSAPSSARATGRRPRASTRWAPSSSTARAGSRARSTSAFPTRSTGPSPAPAPTSWCTAAASRSAATP